MAKRSFGAEAREGGVVVVKGGVGMEGDGIATCNMKTMIMYLNANSFIQLK